MKLDLHPEDLIDRLRQGALTDAERSRLGTHLAACSACTFELAAARDLEEDARPEAGDSRLLERSFEAILRPAPPLPRWSRARLGVAAAAVLLFVGSVAGAAFWAGLRSVPDAARPARPGTTSPARIDRQTSSGSSPHGTAAPGPVPAAEPAPIAPVHPAVRPQREAVPLPRAPVSAQSAADLYSAANAARREGSAAEAARMYRELLTSFPGSREAAASRVTLGRLLLDRLGDPAGAVPLFDSYLAGGGTLAEEARLGRALALGRLGRSAQERAAWQDLLARHPQSVHADRARSRIEALR